MEMANSLMAVPWLKAHGEASEEKGAPAFEDNAIDGEVLRELTADDLKDLGVIQLSEPQRAQPRRYVHRVILGSEERQPLIDSRLRCHRLKRLTYTETRIGSMSASSGISCCSSRAKNEHVAR
jgi:hypothetical protein